MGKSVAGFETSGLLREWAELGFRFRLTGKPPDESPRDGMTSVAQGHIWDEHVRTVARDDRDPVGLTYVHQRRIDIPLSRNPIDPHEADARADAFFQDSGGNDLRCHEESASDSREYVLKPRETAPSFNLVGSRIDEYDVIASDKKFSRESSAEVIAIPGDTDNSKSLLLQELPD